jgi:ABC-2 type transport system permease protein
VSARVEAPQRDAAPISDAYLSAHLIREPPHGWARIWRGFETFADLFFVQFSTIRTGWQWIFLTSSALPLGILLFMSFIVPHSHRGTVLYFISGNVVVALMLNPLFMLSGQLSWARQSHAFDFYAGLPLSRTALIIAGISVTVMFTIPGMILLLIVGMQVFHLWVFPNLLIILIMLLAPTALSGVGALIGVLAPNQQISGVTANLMMLIIMFLSPIFAPAARLPAFLQMTSRLLPTTYAAEALRQTLNGRITGRFALDLAVLALYSLVTIYIVTTKLDWRSR